MCDVLNSYIYLYMMKRNNLWLVISCLIETVTSSFYHEPSFKIIEDKNDRNELFGYTLGYQKQQEKLVLGAPNTPMGEIYSCPKSSLFDGESCNPSKEMNSSVLEQLSSTRSHRAFDDYKYMLGASIAILKESLVTCAPMWSGDNEKYGYFVWGACFEVKNENVSLLGGVYGHPRQENLSMSSFGWKTLVDDTNNLLLLSKPSATPMLGDIAYVDIKKGGSLGDIRSLVFDDTILLHDNKTKPTYRNMLKNYRNFGSALALGRFWEMDKVIYAISITDNNLEGRIVFLNYENGNLRFLMNAKSYKPKLFYLEYLDDMDFTPKNIMFGTALCGARLYGGRFTDLVVGAPAQHGLATSDPEFGAIHIYKGSFKMKDFFKRKLTIMSEKEESRFGSSIVANDLDGDYLQEIFVSAPYQGEGVLYIFSGYEISLQTRSTVDVSDFKSTQIIKKEGFKLLGFSVVTLPDLDDNGCDEIAIGAPESNKVLILRCIPAVTIDVTSEILANNTIIPPDVNKFQIRVCINMDYKSNMERISANVSLENTIKGQLVNITCEPKSADFDISTKEKKYCENITVSIEGNEPGRYTFSSEAKLITDASGNEVFDPSWVRVSPHSVMSKIQYIKRACSGEDCNYHLSLDLLWSGGEIKEGNKYSVDFKKDEILTLRINNEGRIAFTACALVNVVGAPVDQLECSHNPDAYVCRLPERFKKGDSRDIPIKLKITELTNEFKGLNVTVNLYNDCDEKSLESRQNKQFYMEYEFTTDKIEVKSSSETNSITEKTMKSSSETIEVTHIYWITNKGKVLWKAVEIDIATEDTDSTKELVVTTEKMHPIDTSERNSRFTLNLNPLSTVKLEVTVILWRKQIEKLVLNNMLMVTSNLTLSLFPTSVKIKSSTTSRPEYKKDTTIGQNVTLIITIAVIVAILFIAAVIYIMYRIGFFRRKQKEELQAEKRRSIRQSNNYSSLQDVSLIEIKDDKIADDSAALCDTDQSDVARSSKSIRASSRAMSYQKMGETSNEEKSE